MISLLKQAWDKRKKLRAEGDKLFAEGNKLLAEGRKLFAEGNKLRAEGNKLYVEGNLVYINCVLEYYKPNAIINWNTGEVNGELLALSLSELKGVIDADDELG